MSKIVAAVETLAKKELSNPVVSKTLHTAWQAALGAVVAAVSGTHGDIKGLVLVGVAAAAAAVKNALIHDVAPSVLVPSPASAQSADNTIQPAPAVVEPPATAS